MAYRTDISSGNPPLNWSKLKTALDQINENFLELGAGLAQYADNLIVHIEPSNPVRIVTNDPHNLTAAQQVSIRSSGVSQLDGNTYYVSIVDTKEVQLYADEDLTTPVDGTTHDAYPSGGGIIQGFSPFASIDFTSFRSSIVPADAGEINLGSLTKQWGQVHIASQSDAAGKENNGLWLGLAKVQGIGTTVDLPIGSTVGGDLIINPDQTFFKSVQVDNDDRVVADDFVDTLNLISGTAISMAVDSGAESITITNTGVTQAAAGTGIGISGTTGNITFTNTGVTDFTNSTSLPAGLTAGTGLSVSSATGSITLTNTGVIEVQPGFGITVFTDTATGVATVTNNAPAVPTFQTFAVDGQAGVSPDNTADTIEFIQGRGITLTTDAFNDTITFAVNTNLDIVGSVFSDDSTLLVDGIAATLHGDLYANVWGDDSTQLINFDESKVVGPIDTSQLRTSEFTVRLGYNAGRDTGEFVNSVAVGSSAATVSQGSAATAVGYAAGNDTQSNEATALGFSAGNTRQGLRTVAIGAGSGNIDQGDYGVAIGYQAGRINQHNNSIIINAVGSSDLNSTAASAFYVKPIRNQNHGNFLKYNATTGEIAYHEGGTLNGELIGSVFADNSTKLVDGVEGKIVGPIESDDIRGSFIGTVFADDSSVVINEEGTVLGTIAPGAAAPASETEAAPVGEIRVDDNYVYVRKSTGWGKIAIGGWV